MTENKNRLTELLKSGQEIKIKDLQDCFDNVEDFEKFLCDYDKMNISKNKEIVAIEPDKKQLYIQFVEKQGRVNILSFQKAFNLGYSQATKILDNLVAEGDLLVQKEANKIFYCNRNK